MRKKIFASFMAALITAISLSGCSQAENSQEMAKSNAGKARLKRIQERWMRLFCLFYSK